MLDDIKALAQMIYDNLDDTDDPGVLRNNISMLKDGREHTVEMVGHLPVGQELLDLFDNLIEAHEVKLKEVTE